jgi:excisionase family DNA binding protein
MRKRDEEPKPQADDKILDVHAGMQGTLRFDDPVNLRINGKFEGTLDTKGMLMIGAKADIKANITGDSISISGNVKGNIKATKILKMEPTARLEGDVQAPKVSIAEGAVLNGNINMTGAASSSPNESARGDWMTVSQLSKYLEVDNSKITDWVNNGMLPGTREGGDWVFERSKVDQWIAEGKVKA